MRPISDEQVLGRLRAENLWWSDPRTVHPVYDAYRPRAYFDLLDPLIAETAVRRAVLVMGPRRVGKTVLLHQVIRALIAAGVNHRTISYVSVENPVYGGLGLDQLLERVAQASGSRQSFVFFDEIQYFRDWELHLKTLVDAHPSIRFVASGSAAAALRLKSTESGAGRFTDFLLPPLTFHEYLYLLGVDGVLHVIEEEGEFGVRVTDMDALNRQFLHYLNYGGYPEALFSAEIQADPQRFIKADIVDKVLLRDLPSLYGIQDIPELNHLFTALAYNTAGEVSLDELSKNSGVAKNTIKRYIEYLEAAFLIKVVHRVSRSAKRFQRAHRFKTYLTNPSIRSALFAPVSAEDESVGALAETAIFSQWFHSPAPLYYARWESGEVDIVALGPRQKARWVVDVKWSDRHVDRPQDLRSLLAFCRANRLVRATVTTRTRSGRTQAQGVDLEFVPSAVYCFRVGYDIVRARSLSFDQTDRSL